MKTKTDIHTTTELNEQAELKTSYNYTDDLDKKLESIDFNNIYNTYNSYKTTRNFSQKVNYDSLGRLNDLTVSNSNGEILTHNYSYLKHGERKSNRISSIWYGLNSIVKDSLKYAYDEKGNISKVFENGIELARYFYDENSRLIREDNKKLDKTFFYEYDKGGNIVRKTSYKYNLNNRESITSTGTTYNYSYPTSGWKDQLLSFNNLKCEYDKLGNPTTYKGKSLKWGKVRNLESYDNVSYAYDKNGIRTSKTITTTATDSDADPSIEITSSSDNKQKTINLKFPKQKQGTSYRNKGTWNSTEKYVNNSDYIDTVSLNGCTYFCKVTNTNISPVDNADSETWGLMASRSGDGTVTIVDNLNSTNNTYALSAKQGKFIKDNYSLKRSSIYKGTCSTATLTASKIVRCENFVLETGATIDITFEKASVINATLNVNGTGARSIKYQSGAKSLTTANGISLFTNAGGWYGGETIRFIYNGTYWIAVYNLSKGVRIGKCNAYSADTSSKIKTQSNTTSKSDCYLTFVSTNSSSESSNKLYTNEKVTYNPDTGTLKVDQLSDGNNSKSVSDIISAKNLPIGAIFQSAIKLDETEYKLLDGSSHSQDGIYSEFVTWLKQEKNKGNVPVYENDEDLSIEGALTAEQKFTKDVTQTGNCGKFVIDDDNNTFRFPKITNFTQGITINNENVPNFDEMGNSISAGLPNITGELTWITAASTSPRSSGALYYKNKVGGIMSRVSDSINNSNDAPSIDASRCSSIYGNSNTVQPSATQFPFYMVVANAVKPNVNIQMDNIASDLALKANKTDLEKSIVFKYFAKNLSQVVSESNNNVPLYFDDNTTDIRITTHGGNLLINGGIGCYQQNGGNHIVCLYVDGEYKAEIGSSTTLQNSIMPLNYYLTNVPPGEHTIMFVGAVSVCQAIFNEWTTAGITIQEV